MRRGAQRLVIKFLAELGEHDIDRLTIAILHRLPVAVVAGLKPDELVRLTCEDLNILLGLKGPPVFQNTAFYPRAIPQYNVGYGKFKQLLKDLESKTPGLYFAGHFRDGVSLGDSIVSGTAAK